MYMYLHTCTYTCSSSCSPYLPCRPNSKHHPPEPYDCLAECLPAWLSGSWSPAYWFYLVRRLSISWFSRFCFCGRCRNLEFTITITIVHACMIVWIHAQKCCFCKGSSCKAWGLLRIRQGLYRNVQIGLNACIDVYRCAIVYRYYMHAFVCMSCTVMCEHLLMAA